MNAFYRFAIALIAVPSLSFAQDVEATPTPTSSSSSVLIGEGIAGHTDSKRRAPQVSLRVARATDRVSLILDSNVLATDYRDLPIKFDYYVNRQFVGSQIRSKELPGAVGFDIGSDIASPPFNYSVVATVLHPNRQFVTVIQGAVYDQELALSFDGCTVTLPGEILGEDQIFTASSVATTQSGPGSVEAEFDVTNDSKTVPVSFQLTLGEDDAVSGTVSYEDGDETSVPVTGTLTDDESASLSVSSSDESVSVICE